MHVGGIAPLFGPEVNTNLFGHYFGIEFHLDGRIYVRPISPFEYTRCFGLIGDLTYTLSQPTRTYSADCGVPARTSLWILDHMFDWLCELRDANCQVFDPAQYSAPVALCQTFVNGAIGARLPTAAMWKRAYDKDPEMILIRDMIKSPINLTKKNLAEVNFNYRAPLLGLVA